MREVGREGSSEEEFGCHEKAASYREREMSESGVRELAQINRRVPSSPPSSLPLAIAKAPNPKPKPPLPLPSLVVATATAPFPLFTLSSPLAPLANASLVRELLGRRETSPAPYRWWTHRDDCHSRLSLSPCGVFSFEDLAREGGREKGARSNWLGSGWIVVGLRRWESNGLLIWRGLDF